MQKINEDENADEEKPLTKEKPKTVNECKTSAFNWIIVIGQAGLLGIKISLRFVCSFGVLSLSLFIYFLVFIVNLLGKYLIVSFRAQNRRFN